MAATGSAVGLGNIWKFPYITGEYGGGAFLLVYLACIFAVGIPVMMAEVLLGRAGRTDPIDSMLNLAKESGASRNWSIIGIMGVLTGIMILAFYSVVAGWTLDYVWQSATGAYSGFDAAAIEANFGSLTGNFETQFVWHTIFTMITCAVVATGVVSGIGNAVRILMPLLFLLLLVILGYSVAEGDFNAGLSFMFESDFSKLSAEAVLVALGHAFFTLSLGMGAILAYGSYMPRKADIAKTVVTVALLDTAIALVAGMAIFPLVFANNMEPGAGPGLLFVSLPIAFAQMTDGAFFGTVFFALVSIAALSSAISIIEPGVSWLEKRGIKRVNSTIGLGAIAWLGGVASIKYGSVFNALDYLTANIMLPAGGALIALFVGWKLRESIVKEEIKLPEPVYKLWQWSLRIVAPAGIAIIFANSIGLL